MRFAQAGLCMPTNMVSRDFLILFGTVHAKMITRIYI